MFEVRFHGRGGRVVTASELLSMAAFAEGRQAQAFPMLGSERMGAPVVAFCRIDDREIRPREPIARRSLLPAHGQALPRRATEVAIVLREPERRLFDDAGLARLPAHHLALRIQPDEGISLVFRAKEPGPGMALDAVPMDFSYGGSFRTQSAEAYERLMHDAMAGDQTHFLREDAVERSWEIVTPVLDAPGPVHRYAAGTRGPSGADELIAPRAWRPG